MDRLERFYKIDLLLKERSPVSFAVFKEELGMSPASVKRDLQYMRDRFNAPIEYDRDMNGYRFGRPRSGPRYELPGLWFSADEAYALVTMQSLLAELQPGLLEPHVGPLRERLQGILGTGEHTWRDVEKRIRVFQPERRGSRGEHFGTIAKAVLGRARLWIRHYNRGENRETEREVSPQRLVHYRDNWYLDAYCHLREGLRSFAVDAIRAAELRDGRAKAVPDGELDEHLGSSYGIFAGRPKATAALKFTARAARWAAARTWHPHQKERTEKDGSYVVEVPYAEDRELLMDILHYGADVEVLGPPALREKVKAELEKARSNYE
jgi:predicted DNA-binding transcriptional regulator YafY